MVAGAAFPGDLGAAIGNAGQPLHTLFTESFYNSPVGFFHAADRLLS